MIIDVYQTKWFAVEECTHCRGRLSEYQVLYSGGSCPKCGHREPNTGTIVDTNVYSAKREYFIEFSSYRPLISWRYIETTTKKD